MKAVFVAPNLEIGGAERQWSILVPALVERGVVAEVFTLDGEGRFFDELVSRGIRTECVELHGRLPVLGAFKAARTIALRSPHVVVTEGVSAHVVGHLASRRVRAPHVAAIHGIPEPPMSERQKMILRVLAPKVAASTAVTKSQLAFLAALGFRRDAMCIIPNGVAALPARRPQSEVRAELEIGERDFLALLLASLRPEKRGEHFVEAIARANREDPRIRGIVAGGGPDLGRVRSRCAETGSVVIALGPRADVADLIQASDAVCLTSDAEALPLSLLDAMALGRPVVATDVGGVRDAVVEGETGFVVAPGDVTGFAAAVVKLAADPGAASRLGEAGRLRHRDRFTVERMVRAHLDLFEQLVACRAKPVRSPLESSGASHG
ncbi:glycosyltransferase family 4 protein [soil metagenome]